jgi:hypothetical protein
VYSNGNTLVSIGNSIARMKPQSLPGTYQNIAVSIMVHYEEV